MNRFCFVLFCFTVVIFAVFTIGFQAGKPLHLAIDYGNRSSTINVERKPYLSSRRILRHGFCTNRDISISQSRYSTTGIPQFIVQIVNTCISGCPPSNIHLHCGWFASARMVNPRIFRRIAFDDCLVNGGRPLRTSQIISFTYSNSFMYPLSLKSAHFC